MAESKLGFDTRRRILIVHYFAFTLAYCVSIVFAVILGATLGLVPPIDFWLRIAGPFFIHVSIIGLWLFIVCLPILFVTNLNVIWSGRFLEQRYGSTSNAIRTVLGVIVAAPLLIIAVCIYILVGHIFAWPGVLLVLGPILSGFPLVYVLVIIGIMTKDTKQLIPDCAKDPRFWFVSLLLIAILLFPLAALGLPLQKGYFQYFQSEELFLMNIPDLVARALMIASVLPAIPLAFLRLRDEILLDPQD
jgi:hypothetical protein